MNRLQKSLMRLAGIELPKPVKKSWDTIGSFINLGNRKLADEKSVSYKLIESYGGWVYINSSVLAEAVSKIEIKLYQTGYSQGQLVLNEVQTHPLLDLLDRFNDSTTSSDGFYITESHLNLTGDSFWYTPLQNGLPTDIFPLRPDKIQLKLGDITRQDGQLIEAYLYKDKIDGTIVEQTYSPDEIIPIKVPNPGNMFRGKSTVEAIANDIDIDNYAGQTLREFFENGMIVQFALSSDQRINNDQITSFQSQLRSTFGGSRNAWKVPIFGGGLKPVELQMSSKDMQLIEQMKWLRDKIMIAFKNTPASIGIIEDVNRANSESTLANWKSSVIKPKMARIVDSLNEFLVPKYGDNLILGFEDPSPEDSTEDIGSAVQLYSGQIITQNEAREMVGLDAVPGGDDFKTTPTPFGPLPKAVVNVNYKAVFRRQGITKEYEAYKRSFEKAMPMARQVIKLKAKKPVKQAENRPKYGFSIEQVDKYAANILKIVDHHEQIFNNAVTQLLNKGVEEGINNFNSLNARKSGKLIDKDKLVADAVNKLEPIMTQILIQAGNQAYKLIKVDEPYIPKAMKEFDSQKYIRDQVALFMGSAYDTDIDEMAGIIADGLKNELSVPEIRNGILDKFSDYTKMQAERITRTEVIRTSNQGALDAFEQSGVVEGKQWLATEDDRTDEECAALDGQIVSSVRGEFYSDTTEFADGDPPLHPNCRCVVLPILVGEKTIVQLVDKEAAKRERELNHRIEELEAQIDKRTKAFRDIKAERSDDKLYIKMLEKHLGLSDES